VVCVSALLLLVLAAGEVVVQVEPGTPCLEARKVEAQLVAQGLRVQESAVLKVTARGAGSVVVLDVGAWGRSVRALGAGAGGAVRGRRARRGVDHRVVGAAAPARGSGPRRGCVDRRGGARGKW
jgi:hypothetical protein